MTRRCAVFCLSWTSDSNTLQGYAFYRLPLAMLVLPILSVEASGTLLWVVLLKRSVFVA